MLKEQDGAVLLVMMHEWSDVGHKPIGWRNKKARNNRC